MNIDSRADRRNECYDAMHFFASSHENDPSIHSKRPEAGWKKLVVLPGMPLTLEDKVQRDVEALAEVSWTLSSSSASNSPSGAREREIHEATGVRTSSER